VESGLYAMLSVTLAFTTALISPSVQVDLLSHRRTRGEGLHQPVQHS
jgi:hypothetical protein